MLVAFDWVAAASLLGAAWFALAALEVSLLGVEALDWFIADVSLGVAAAEEGEVVLPADPLLLPVVQ